MNLVGIVYNACFGGFGLSREAVLLGRKLSGDPTWFGPSIKGDLYDNDEPVESDYGYNHKISRSDPILVRVVHAMGNDASGTYADLRIIWLKPGTRYRINEYDGNETVIFETEQEWLIA